MIRARSDIVVPVHVAPGKAPPTAPSTCREKRLGLGSAVGITFRAPFSPSPSSLVRPFSPFVASYPVPCSVSIASSPTISLVPALHTCFSREGNDPTVLPHRQDGGAGGADVADAAYPLRQPDSDAQHPTELERPDLPGHVVQPDQEHGAGGDVSVGRRGATLEFCEAACWTHLFSSYRAYAHSFYPPPSPEFLLVLALFSWPVETKGLADWDARFGVFGH